MSLSAGGSIPAVRRLAGRVRAGVVALLITACGGATSVPLVEAVVEEESCTGAYSTSVVREVLGPIVSAPSARPGCPGGRDALGERVRVRSDGRVDQLDRGAVCAWQAGCFDGELVASIRFPPLPDGECAWVTVPE